jgi:hypothetical protein
VGGQARDVLLAQPDAAAAHGEESHDAVDGGGLPGAVAPDQAYRFGVADPKADVPEHVRRSAEGIDAFELGVETGVKIIGETEQVPAWKAG